jgi:hypothetical protein
VSNRKKGPGEAQETDGSTERSIPGDDRSPVEPIIQAHADDAGVNRRHRAAKGRINPSTAIIYYEIKRVTGITEVVIEIFCLGRPMLAQRIFEAPADREPGPGGGVRAYPDIIRARWGVEKKIH